MDNSLIKRQDAIDAINAYLGLSAVSRTIQNMTSIQEILEKLPAVDADLSTFSDNLWKIAYERGKKEGMQQLHDYQVEWLKSHDDLQLDPQLEKMIIRFLHDTTNCLLMERGDSE